jgi:hypothetical protein
MASRKVLKRDALGTIYRDDSGSEPAIVRDMSDARWGCRWLARRLARREAAALRSLADLPGVPNLIRCGDRQLVRSLLAGEPMYAAPPPTAAYFREALRLVRRMHGNGVAHNDLAKEANWLCLGGDEPGVVDFQLAVRSRRRGRLFRLLAREDLRHLLKHKHHYLAHRLTARQRAMLAAPSPVAAFWRICIKPPYRFVTRFVLGWPERRSAEERGAVPRE